MNDYIRVGVIASTHGIKGEVKVFPTTDDVNRFKKLKKVTLDNKREKIELEIEGVKFFKKFAILKFKGYDNINDIEKHKGKDLYITRDEAVKLQPGEYFIFDLIGLSVVTDTDEVLGELIDVLQTGANDVYVVRRTDSTDEILLPAIKECILSVSLEDKLMRVHLMEGLI